MQITTDILERAVDGRNLGGETLAEALGDGPTLLVFLRHLG